MFLQVLQQRTAGAVHDALGFTGGAGRVEDVERRVEGHRREFDLRHRSVADLREGRPLGFQPQHVDPQNLTDGRHALHDAGDLVTGVDELAVVGVAVTCEEHGRFYLAKTVERALDAEIRRTAGPHTAERTGRQHGDDGLRSVRQPGGRSHTGPHTQCPQCRYQSGHLPVEFAEAQFATRARFQIADDGRPLVPKAQQILGEVELSVMKPACSRKLFAIQEGKGCSARGGNLREVPERLPECVGLCYRPLMQCIVGCESTSRDPLCGV